MARQLLEARRKEQREREAEEERKRRGLVVNHRQAFQDLVR